jgi:hypothetical protein
MYMNPTVSDVIDTAFLISLLGLTPHQHSIDHISTFKLTGTGRRHKDDLPCYTSGIKIPNEFLVLKPN